MADMSYTYKKLETPEEELELHQIPSNPAVPATPRRSSIEKPPSQRFFATTAGKIIAIAVFMGALVLALALVAVVQSAVLEPRATSTASTADVPQYFQTTPELFAGAFWSFNANWQTLVLNND